MSTSGLTVTRDDGPSRSVARHGMTPCASAPGSCGPNVIPATMAAAPMSAPVRSIVRVPP